MLTAKNETLYAVARGTTILSDGYTTPDIADMQLNHLSETMTAVGLEPDLQVVTVEVKTTLGKPKPYSPPTQATVDDHTTTEANQAPADTQNPEN